MMTDEEKREQMLKRVLPGLAITIIYFVFASGIISEKMKKAETDYKNLASAGASKEILPGIMAQQGQVQQQLGGIEKKVAELQEQFKKMAGFLSNSGASTNTTMAKITTILDDAQVRLRKDEKAEFQESQLSPALKEIWQAIKPKESATPPPAATPASPTDKPKVGVISVHHLWLKGGYKNMYQALNAIASPSLQVLPISLTMVMPEVDLENSGELEWELILWM